MDKPKFRHFDYSFISNLRYRVNGGMLLMIVALLALIIANSPWGNAYAEFWNHPVRLQIGDFNLFNHGGQPLTLMGFINDALMAIFFFTVGLEIKREILVGELSSIRQALLPIIAACGGMIIPVAVYYFLTNGTPEADGLAIPMATDIAFSLGVLSLFGKRVPLSLKIFLTAFAVVDDIGGILIIALFYSSHLAVNYLIASAVLLALLCLGNYMNIRKQTFYLFFGIIMWYLFLQSGVHSTIAGVIVAFTVPASPSMRIGKYIERIREHIHFFPISGNGSILLEKEQINILKAIESSSSRVISPLQKLEDNLHAVVNYFVMPLFAFANAGVVLSAGNGEKIFGLLTIAVALGLIVGKFVGIYAFTWVSIKAKIVSMPQGMDWKNVAGVALLGGIGFTVSLFIANLSFGNQPELLNQAKLGVLIGTVVSGVLGYIVLKIVLPKEPLLET